MIDKLLSLLVCSDEGILTISPTRDGRGGGGREKEGEEGGNRMREGERRGGVRRKGQAEV